jgi:ketosteroid isomerase-like protein
VKHRIVTGLVGVAAAIGIYFAFFSQSDEQKIRAVLGRLSKAIGVSEGDTNPILRGARARVHSELVETFPPDVHVSVPELPQIHRGRSELEGAVTRAALVYRTAEVDLARLEIKLDDAHENAKVAVAATLRATRGDGEAKLTTRAVNFLVSKNDGKWRITSLTVWPEGEATP